MHASEFSTGRDDAYVIGQQFLFFRRSMKISGFLLWGTPGTTDLDALEGLLVATHRALGPHARVGDTSALDGAPGLLFERMVAFAERGAMAGSIRTKCAVVHGTGICGAAMAGFAAVAKPVCRLRSFGRLDVALRWLGESDPAGLAAELEHLRDHASNNPADLRRFRAVLDAALPEPDVVSLARNLSLSTRALQRRLAAQGTTFMREVARARMTRGVTLLEHTNTPISRIAIDLGFTSVSHFSTLVKRWTGLSPTVIRARRLGSSTAEISGSM